LTAATKDKKEQLPPHVNKAQSLKINTQINNVFSGVALEKVYIGGRGR